MPTEIRHVIFSNEEALAALRYCAIRSGRPFPHQPVMRLDGGAHSSVIVTAAAAGDNLAEAFYFSTEQLLAALLLFCNKEKIPLPVCGTKEIAVVNRRLMLVIKVPTKEPAETRRNLAHQLSSRQSGANWERHSWQK